MISHYIHGVTRLEISQPEFTGGANPYGARKLTAHVRPDGSDGEMLCEILFFSDARAASESARQLTPTRYYRDEHGIHYDPDIVRGEGEGI